MRLPWPRVGAGFLAVVAVLLRLPGAGSKFAEFAKRLMRVAGFALPSGRILRHDWTGIFVDISFEAN
jgi:hypothetical protein